MSSSQNKKCGICSGSLTNQATFTAQCSHSFHFSCISTRNRFASPNTVPLCPLCKPIPNNTNVFQSGNIKNASSFRSSYAQSAPVHKAEPLQFSDDDPLLSSSSSSTAGLQKVTVKAIPERDALAASESVPQFTVLIGLKAPPLPSSQQRVPIDLVTVLDVSGSMQGAKLNLVKRAVHFVIDELGPSDRLSIVSFSDQAQRIFRLSRMTETGRKDAKLAVDSLSVVGGTNIFEGLKKGARVLGERRFKNPVASIIFLSDGNDSYNSRTTKAVPKHLRRPPPLIYPGNKGVPQQEVKTIPVHSFGKVRSIQAPPKYLCRLPPSIYPGNKVGPQQGVETIPVHSFGFGSDHDPVTMHAIADASGGTFSYIESYEMVQGAFASCIGGLLSVVTQELRLNLRTASKGVVIKLIPSGRYKSKITDRGSKGLINVGDLYADEEKEFLINLSIPKQKTSLLDIECSYRDAVSKKESVEIQSVEIRRVNAVLPSDMKVKLEVDRQRNRLIAAESIAEAQKMAETGDVMGARTLLEKSRTDIVKSESAQAGDELCVWLEEDMKETERRMGSLQQYHQEGRAYALSGISSHGAQRATTKGKSVAGAAAPCGGAGGSVGGGGGGRYGGRYNPYSTKSMALMVVKSEKHIKKEK